MTNSIPKRYLWLSLILAGVVVIWPRASQAVGISPAVIVVDNMVPQMQTTKEIWFTRSDASQTETLEVTLTGPAADYVIPEQSTSTITFPAGQQMLLYPITIQTDNLNSGTYEATLTVTPQATAAAGATPAPTTQLLAGAQANIRFTITTSTVEQFQIDTIAIHDSEVGAPLTMSYHMRNNSNVAAKPAQITLQIMPDYTTTITDQDIPTVAAQTEDTVTVTTTWPLPVGTYQVDLNFVDHTGTTVATATKLPLEIFPSGTLAQRITIADVQQNVHTVAVNQGVLTMAMTFSNGGSTATTVTPIIDIYRGSRLVDTVTGEAVVVPANASAQSTVAFRPTRFGYFSATVYGLFGPKRTNTVSATFTAYAIWPIISASLGASALGMFIGLVLYRYFTRKRSTNTSIKRSPPPPKKQK